MILIYAWVQIFIHKIVYTNFILSPLGENVWTLIKETIDFENGPNEVLIKIQEPLIINKYFRCIFSISSWLFLLLFYSNINSKRIVYIHIQTELPGFAMIRLGRGIGFNF